MKSKLLSLIIISLHVWGLDTSEYSLVTPKGWKEIPNLFGSDVILTAPLDGRENVGALYLRMLDKEMLPAQVPAYLQQQLEQFAIQTKQKFKIEQSSSIGLKHERIYLQQATQEDGEKLKLLIFAVTNHKKLLFGHFQAAAEKYSKAEAELTSALRTLIFSKDKN